MTEHDDIELTILETLHQLTGEAICEEKGHRFRELKPVHQPDATTANTFSSTETTKHCLRCGEIKYEYESGETTITVASGEAPEFSFDNTG